MAAAISSRKLSLPKVFCMRPGARIHAAGSGVSSSQCAVSLLFGNAYGNAQSRVGEWPSPGVRIFGSLASTAASSVAPERLHRLLGQEHVGLPKR